MKTIYKLIFSILFLNIIDVNAQVTKLRYLMEYNPSDSTYNAYVVIIEGSAMTAPHRAQFNAQVSIVTPASSDFKLLQNFMPLQGNNIYTGIYPLQWVESGSVKSPTASKNENFYSITPTLSPTSFYNNLAVGDAVKLFKFKVSPLPINLDNVRFFNNNTDPKSNAPGMGGGDFHNTFTIGGIAEDYSGNLPLIINNVSATNEMSSVHVDIFPNPTSNIINIVSPTIIKNVKLINLDGKSIDFGPVSQIDITSYNAGIYFFDVTTNEGRAIKKVVKI